MSVRSTTNTAPEAPTANAPAVSVSPRPRKRLSRLERSPEARELIFAAAARVVGTYGYAEASIARITEAAGIAQGTFYLYFKSRQDLFDELLPHVGQDMLVFIRGRIQGSTDVFEMEERALRAFFEYLAKNPGFFRILNEAEVASPKAHRRHFKLLSEHYAASLERSARTGQICGFALGELETLAYIFMAARSYLYLRYVKNGETPQTLPEAAIQTYMKLLRSGLA